MRKSHETKAMLVAPRDMHERDLRPTDAALRRAVTRQATDSRGVMPARQDATPLSGIARLEMTQDVHRDPTARKALRNL